MFEEGDVSLDKMIFIFKSFKIYYYELYVIYILII